MAVEHVMLKLVGNPGRKVRSLSGDGAFGNVMYIQKKDYGGRHIAVDLHNPDFAALARCFGMQGLSDCHALMRTIPNPQDIRLS